MMKISGFCVNTIYSKDNVASIATAQLTPAPANDSLATDGSAWLQLKPWLRG